MPSAIHDFYQISAPGTASSVAAQTGAPSPEGLTSPAYSNNQTVITLLDPSVGAAVAPNRDRIAGGGAFGTLIVRRTIKNISSVGMKNRVERNEKVALPMSFFL